MKQEDGGLAAEKRRGVKGHGGREQGRRWNEWMMMMMMMYHTRHTRGERGVREREKQR